ncbi:hypothetical protein GCM10010365_68040 [Streptomyces poonensis]|uniref:Uncharacterized protein n=1 Tax=Streptomyces poonensis TaxID=68255 RepID=A0A918Q992_9ACTN|nr:hypothetical protein GCM10010365_68040 [Streptomyces poonensis]GLJ91136.1 hypothetical protein GCM10017589_37420 [Streptomyces poonensis]
MDLNPGLPPAQVPGADSGRGPGRSPWIQDRGLTPTGPRDSLPQRRSGTEEPRGSGTEGSPRTRARAKPPWTRGRGTPPLKPRRLTPTGIGAKPHGSGRGEAPEPGTEGSPRTRAGAKPPWTRGEQGAQPPWRG